MCLLTLHYNKEKALKKLFTQNLFLNNEWIDLEIKINEFFWRMKKFNQDFKIEIN